MATRAASGKVLNALAPVLPELWGGSGTWPSPTTPPWPGRIVRAAGSKTAHWDANPYGRTLHFGIREHAMGSILTGIVMHGPTRPYGGTFLQFSDYMRAPSGWPR